MELLISHSKDTLGTGVSKSQIRDLEARLDIELPKEFRQYLLQYNYAELYRDPIFGIQKNNPEIDLYSRNLRTDHFKYGFLQIFSNDIDGAIYLRPDSGAIYRGFTKPAASSFNAFLNLVLNNGS